VVLKLGQFENISEIPGKFTNWCQRRMENKRWTDRVNKGEVLQGVEERNIVQTIKRRKANWIGHVLSNNCLLKHVTEGKIKGYKGKENEEEEATS